MKRTLLLLISALTCLGTWAQSVTLQTSDGTTAHIECEGNVGNMPDVKNYQFTSTAQGNLYTSSYNIEAKQYEYSVETTTQGAACNKGYYVATHYKTPVSAKSVKLVESISSKAYYIKGADSYTSAYNTNYTDDASIVYATVNTARQLDFSSTTTDDYTNYLTTGYLFNVNAVNAKFQYVTYNESTSSWIPGEYVKLGDVCESDTYYWAWNYQHKGSELASWGNASLGTAFKSTSGICTLSNGVYSLIASTSFDASTDYYLVTFTDNATVAEEDIDYKEVWDLPSGSNAVYTWNGTEYVAVNDGDDYVDETTYYNYDEANTYYAERSQDELVTAGYATVTGSTPYWTDLVKIINSAGFTSIVFKTKNQGTGDNKTYATISNTVTQAMMQASTVTSLDYSGVQINELHKTCDSFNGSEMTGLDNDGTFIYGPGNWTENTALKSLVLPHIANTTKTVGGVAHRHVPTSLGLKFKALEEITMSDNATCVETYAFGAAVNGTLKKIVLNDGLKMIAKAAFCATTHLTNLTFPSSIEYIGDYAFSAGGMNDVYFLGTKAPIVSKYAFSDKAYLNNNAIVDDATIASRDWYRITRSAYVSGSYMAAMLHFPKSVTAAQRAAYTDPQRDYHVFEWLPYETKVTKDKEGNALESLEDAKEAFPLASEYVDNGDGSYTLKFDAITSSDITKEVYNNGTDVGATGQMYYYCAGEANTEYDCSPSWGASQSSTNLIDCGGRTYAVDASGNITYGNGYNHHKSGMYDYYVGEQYRWPGQSFMIRAFDVASQGLLWDGHTTIAEGIASVTVSSDAKSRRKEEAVVTPTATYDINCDGDIDDEGETFTDGAEYIGLHQFILANSDVSNTSTNKWTFDNLQGANWYTICVPVNMTVAEVRKAFGEDTQVCKFSGVERRNNGDDTPNTQIKFFFTDEQCYGHADDDIAIEANFPYMIRPSKAKDATYTFTLPNYTLADEQIPEQVTQTCFDAQDSGIYTYTFIGQYNTNQETGESLYMPQYSYYLGDAGNNIHRIFFQVGTTGKWKPYTCVIIPTEPEKDYNDFFKPSTEPEAKAIGGALGIDTFDAEDTTPIYEVICGAENAKTSSTAVYNLNGQLVGNSVNGLKSGIYITNGKKYIVK